MTSRDTDFPHPAGAAPHGRRGTLFTASGAHQLDLRLADDFLSRFRGLMLARPLRAAQGLLITHCPSVHGAFLLHPIDVVYLDRAGVVTKCVPGLRPWRASVGHAGKDAQGRPYPRAAHTLELADGAIASMAIRPGDRLSHPCWDADERASGAIESMTIRTGGRLGHPRRDADERARPVSGRTGAPGRAQRGTAMIEFIIVGPIITLLGLAVVQYGMLFFAKNQIQHASFMAAREGATANADPAAIQTAYLRALVPMYGGGQTPAELAASLAKAGADAAGNLDIEMLNPTKESFDDWNDPALQASLHTGARRVIPNAWQAINTKGTGPTSGQTIQDANLIKLRVRQGYLPKVPLVKNIYTAYLTWLDPHTDAFHTKLVNDGRIPVLSHVTVHMQSDAIEPGAPVSTPGPGNGGKPTNPGDPPVTTSPPPDCSNLGCVTSTPGTTPQPPSACDPFTDPAHCVPDECKPGAEICCVPK